MAEVAISGPGFEFPFALVSRGRALWNPPLELPCSEPSSLAAAPPIAETLAVSRAVVPWG